MSLPAFSRSARSLHGDLAHDPQGRRDDESGAGERSPRGAAAARGQDAGDDFRASLDAHPRFVRRRDARARRRDHRADRRGNAARPRRDDRRHRARALPLRRRDHDPHPRSRRPRGARGACDGAGHQRAHQTIAPLSGDGRHPDLRGASWPHRRQEDRLERRLQQRSVVVDRRLGALRVRARNRLPRGIAALGQPRSRGRAAPVRASFSTKTRRALWPTPAPSSRIAGCRWATRTLGDATTC